MGIVYFVSGIDTDAGKTVAVGLMARYLMRVGVAVITAKLVQTGNDGFSEDVLQHRKMMGLGLLQEDREGWTTPQIFSFPGSPHLAARLEQRTVDLEAIRTSVAHLAERYDVVLVEGAGGVAVPLTEEVLTLDFVAQEGWPMILVTSGKLGSLNHTFLSLEAARHRNLPVAGVVYTYCPTAHPVIEDDSQRMIAGRVPALVKIPKVDFSQLPDIDFSALFQ